MHSCAFLTMFLEVETDEKMLKARAIDGPFWRYKNISFSEVGTPENILNWRTMYGAFWRYLKRCSWSWNWKIVKARTQNGIFWRYLKRFLRSWNCREKFRKKGEKNGWWTLMLFESMFWKLVLLRIFWKQRKLNGAFRRFSKNVVDDF